MKVSGHRAFEAMHSLLGSMQEDIINVIAQKEKAYIHTQANDIKARGEEAKNNIFLLLCYFSL